MKNIWNFKDFALGKVGIEIKSEYQAKNVMEICKKLNIYCEDADFYDWENKSLWFVICKNLVVTSDRQFAGSNIVCYIDYIDFVKSYNANNRI